MTAAEQHETIEDSPVGWVAKHIQRYVETDGADGGTYQGVPSLLLTTRGRRTGALRRTALMYGRDGDNHLLVASNGGADKHPAWYLNLSADPAVEIQVGAERFAGRARTATGEERARLWPVMTKVFPTYERYQKGTNREIPLVVIERAPRKESTGN
ncbi:deazaflavin-dependent oxidoreductase (nitroreductase family) [Micromonospora jinlongensis]|uniref:Deazaflavin-dependent oxidoreductase (Nitroreductase family) n=1 Tax=Micromonospora jinlongensis TaxID=1287877 RepID=A0A7Y9WZJ9_9ACTN|nr:nitroreductase family deazaflavin-dependent oxidoreductase [Micromonospora jinlongensis]NYH42334.1 deazaflavin-dependent oxidoreductase (nitroreductase family) [Micromonospora jinlongensis]